MQISLRDTFLGMTVHELLTSERFQLLFQHEHCEQAYRQFRDYAELLGEPQFTVEESNGNVIDGRFLTQADFESGAHGVTAGKFRLTLSDGLDFKDTNARFDSANLEVQIEEAPMVAACAIPALDHAEEN